MVITVVRAVSAMLVIGRIAGNLYFKVTGWY